MIITINLYCIHIHYKTYVYAYTIMYIYSIREPYCKCFLQTAEERAWRRNGVKVTVQHVSWKDAWLANASDLCLLYAWIKELGPMYSKMLMQIERMASPCTAPLHKSLRSHSVLFFTHQHSHVLQKNNTRSHTVSVTLEFLSRYNIRTITSPGLGLDLNRNEHQWYEMM